MSSINQIPKLSKIPQILNKKREAEKESKRKNEKEAHAPFPPEDSVVLENKKPRKQIVKTKKDTDRQSKDQNIGSNLDIII